MARVLFFVVAALAIVSRVAGDDMDEEDDDEVIAEQSGSGPQFQQQQQMSEEEMRMVRCVVRRCSADASRGATQPCFSRSPLLSPALLYSARSSR